MAKRGRPRVERPPVDYGTDELRVKRLALVGPNGDPALAEYPLGILFSRGIIDQDQRNAGDSFANLYAKAQGRMRLLGFDTGNGDMDEKTLAKIEEKYTDCRKLLLRQGRRCFDETVNVCVYRRLPAWLKPFRYTRRGWERDRIELLAGLDLLAAALVGRKARAG